MAKRDMQGERVVVTLINEPRVKLDLIEFSTEQQHYFALRKMRFNATNNVKGYEIRLDSDVAANLVAGLQGALNPSPRGHESVLRDVSGSSGGNSTRMSA